MRLKEFGGFCTTDIANVDHDWSPSENWFGPGDECCDSGGAIGKKIWMIPVNVQDEGCIGGVRVKVAAVLISFYDKPRAGAKVNWGACWAPLPCG
jgi:hypothetical protein